MNVPNIVDVEAVEIFQNQAFAEGKWIAARPLGFQGWFLKLRIKRAWMVFTGNADVLTWNRFDN